MRGKGMGKYLGPLFLSLLGLACHSVFRITGSHVTPDGSLIEPFFLLLIGYLLTMLWVLLPA